MFYTHVFKGTTIVLCLEVMRGLQIREVKTECERKVGRESSAHFLSKQEVSLASEPSFQPWQAFYMSAAHHADDLMLV